MKAQDIVLTSSSDFYVPLRPSRLWGGLIVACVLATGMYWPEHLSRVYGVPLLGLAWCLWRQQGCLEALEVRDGERLFICCNGSRVEVGLEDSSVALPGLIILHYRQASGRKCCVLLFDSAPSDGLRRLRVFIRWRV